ncbi:hypothetical protein Bbelb_031300 [Branchiostoma belcheri]|nr:hypothetical protein Bbelb_031300 [Branchiostoma belcheri]
MKFYVFNSSARLLMERTILESFCPEENEITNADVDFPTKGKRTPKGHQQKWREIKDKLTMESGFLAHKAAPHLAIISSDAVRCTFQKCHLQPDKTTHRSWSETWKQISSAYQTNSTRYGVSQAVFHRLFKECEDCQNSHLPVDSGEINTTQEANSTTQGDDSSDENNSDTSTDSDSSDEEDTSTEDESFNLFSHLGLKPMSSQSPHKRHRRLSQEDYQVYELPQDQLDKHLEDICKQHSVHLIVRKARKCKFKGTNGTIYEGKEKVFACHRSGAPNRKRKTKRKRQVSKKVGCSFRVKVLVPDNTDIPLKIYLHSEHSNHTPGSTEDQKWLPVDQRVLDIAADCLDAGLRIQQTVNILQNALSSGTIGDVDKRRYRTVLTRKELTCLQYERRRRHRVTQDDWLSTYQKLEDYKAQGKCIFFQQYDPENKDPEKRPFVAVLQTDWQRTMAERFTPNSAWSVDSTFGLNSFGLPLYAATVPNQYGQGIPIFFLLTSNEKGQHEEMGLEAGFKAVFQNMEARPNAIIIDKSLTEKRGIEKAVKDDPLSWEGEKQVKCHLLLCWFHTKKAWTENLLPKLPTDVAAKVYDRLCGMMMATTWEKYEEEKEQLYTDFKAHSKAIEKYLKGWDCEEWLPMWVRAGRMFPHGKQDTTNLVEREWMTIKYTIFDGRANHRVDRLLDALIGHPNSGTFQGGQTTVAFHAKKQEEADIGLNTKRTTQTERRRHDHAEMYMRAHKRDPSIIKLVNPTVLFFHIKSESVQGLTHDVSLTEQYCSCDDNARQGQTCKHLIAGHKFLECYHPDMLSIIMPPELHNHTFGGEPADSAINLQDLAQEGGGDTSSKAQLKLQIARLKETLSQVDADVDQMTEYQCKQSLDVVDTCLRNLKTSGTIKKPQSKDERVASARLLKSIQLGNMAARRSKAPSTATSELPEVPAVPAEKPGKRMKVKQVHKRIQLPGKHSSFKRARCDNCGTNNFVAVSKKGKTVTGQTTCKNCDETVYYSK